MADKKYKLKFNLSDGSTKEVEFTSPQGPAGEPGKTAYQYAVDGGYTGTEAEFGAKLAADITDFVVTVTGNSTDGYTADKTYAETRAVYEAGGTVLCVINGESVSGFRLPLGVAIDDSLMFIACPTTSIFIQVVFTETYVVAVEMLSDVTIGSQKWDMLGPVDFTDTINAMIDTKLGVIENGSY